MLLTAASVSSVFILNKKNKDSGIKKCLTYYNYGYYSVVAPTAVGMVVYPEQCSLTIYKPNSWVINQVENSGAYMICVDGTNLCYGHEAKIENRIKQRGLFGAGILYEAAEKLFTKDPTSPFQRWTNTTAQPKRFMNVGTQLCDEVYLGVVELPLKTATCNENYEAQQWNFVDKVK